MTGDGICTTQSKDLIGLGIRLVKLYPNQPHLFVVYIPTCMYIFSLIPTFISTGLHSLHVQGGSVDIIADSSTRDEMIGP